MCIMGHFVLSVSSSPQPTYISMCFYPAKYEKLDHNILSKNIKFVKCNALDSSSEELSSKALELINALKFDKLTYPSSSTIKSQWIDAFFKSISRQRVVTSIQSCLQSQKTSLLDEFNPIISQMERESVSCTIEVLQAFRIDIKLQSKISLAKSIMNKSLEQVLLSHGVDFNSTVTLPQRLSYKKGKIKSFKLF